MPGKRLGVPVEQATGCGARKFEVRRSQGSDENELPQLLTRTDLFGSGWILRPVRFAWADVICAGFCFPTSQNRDVGHPGGLYGFAFPPKTQRARFGWGTQSLVWVCGFPGPQMRGTGGTQRGRKFGFEL